jgi:diguanylate cyclase (GGDEF)-like protein
MVRFQSVLSQLFCNLPREELHWLLSPQEHIAPLAMRRAAMIISRVRLISILLAAPDLFMLQWPMSDRLDMARLFTSIAFVTLAFSFKGSTKMRDAYLALGLMFAIPTVFFAYSFMLVSQHPSGDLTAFVNAIYPFLPIVLVAGLSLFPLTVLELSVFAVPVLAAEVITSMLHMSILTINPLISSSWLVFILVVFAVLSGVSQLAFMIALGLTSFRDALTGGLTRASGVEMIGIQYTIAKRSGSPLSVAFIDLDNFKSINDKFGHDAGDEVLAAAAKRISSLQRTGDTLVRWGGEEFVLIMTNTSIHQAMLAIERLRGKGMGVRPDNQPLTASIGIAEWIEDDAEDWRTLVEIADHRMYEAKRTGKDKMVYTNGGKSELKSGKTGGLFNA